MNCTQDTCAFAQVYEVETRNLTEDVRELKDRVKSLETTLVRGIMLLVANLVGVVVTLAQQLLQH
ncbi:MAG: hypothetical protein K1Y02_22085 [Candidatus Hydrogenedentes bacterium]|nr:hypothetical protein [Candidatus Hydrogenedentota bacterium]